MKLKSSFVKKLAGTFFAEFSENVISLQGLLKGHGVSLQSISIRHVEFGQVDNGEMVLFLSLFLG